MSASNRTCYALSTSSAAAASAVIIVSTDTDEIVRAVDRVCVFDRGTIRRGDIAATRFPSERLRSGGLEGRCVTFGQEQMMSQQTTALARPVEARGPGGALGPRWILHNVVWIWLIGLVVIFGLFNEFFFTTANMQNIMVQATVLGMLGSPSRCRCWWRRSTFRSAGQSRLLVGDRRHGLFRARPALVHGDADRRRRGDADRLLQRAVHHQAADGLA
jgi:hypothetical protein